MNDKPALESSEVVTSKGIGSSALLGSDSFSEIVLAMRNRLRMVEGVTHNT